MMHLDKFAALLIEEYSAEPLNAEEAFPWLHDSQTFIAGFRFGNPRDIFRLIALRDEQLFTEDERSKYLSRRVSPHADMLAIIYRTADNEIQLKLVNGVAGVLVDMFKLWRAMEEQ